ncbi:hypothetical protein FV222_02545 [Methylobacterium sp. WL103]|uniref:hypothetical protein n=1 Tax=Methylobacterium sp. WL103 TaxID=2603891 RepID=UPI0011C91E8C|nr:hypothetical protein [Methylobacterium sp. WL103]TXN07324.1 hypothetical protein FV222_02545 [Methylobacterium sp. WL103]
MLAKHLPRAGSSQPLPRTSSGSSGGLIYRRLIEGFGAFRRERITGGRNPFDEAWLRGVPIASRSIYSGLEGTKPIRKTVIADADSSAAHRVRGFLWKWRTRHDSNV